MVEKALHESMNLRPIKASIPGRRAIDLVAYYPQLADHYHECELQTKRWFVENVQSDWVIFDVGAHIGYYTILFSQLASAGHVYAFEPTKTFAMLQRNLSFNDCQNVTALQVAVGRVSGSVEDDIFRIWSEGAESDTYSFATVDDLVLRFNLARLDCIKIDVDSFDFEVLMGAEQTLRRSNPWIVVELCHALSKRGQSPTQALQWLAGIGYRTAHVIEHDNFVLRRSKDDEDRANAPSIVLTFEDRPVVLPPLWLKGEPIGNVFVAEPFVHNQARIGGEGDRLTIDAPGPRWAFACSWRRQERLKIDRPFLVELRLSVQGGVVGVGCVVDDLSQYVGKEIEVPHSEAVQTVAVYIENAASIGHLVVRNVDPAGRLAEVMVHDLSCFEAKKNPLR